MFVATEIYGLAVPSLSQAINLATTNVQCSATMPSLECLSLLRFMTRPLVKPSSLCAIALRSIMKSQVYEGMVKQLEVLPAAIQQQQQLLAADPTAVLPPLEPAGGPIADLPADQAALVWIQYMRFSRRSESVKESRRVRQSQHAHCFFHLGNLAAVAVGLTEGSYSTGSYCRVHIRRMYFVGTPLLQAFAQPLPCLPPGHSHLLFCC